jgi:RNA polymerase sigma-70 factor (ECF subfamily)
LEGSPQGDAELLARHVAGDPDAFAELVRRHRDRLWAVALRTLGDREEAADALQDAFVSAFRSAHTFRGQSAVTTWLHRITVNACLDRIRRAATRRTAPVAEQQSLDALMEPHESAAAPAERAELHREVVAALATLPVEQRAALVLVDMQGYSVAEAAAILDVPTGTIKSRCARGRARLVPLVRHLRAADADPGGPDPGGTLPAAGTGHSAPATAARNRTEQTPVPETGSQRDGGGHR